MPKSTLTKSSTKVAGKLDDAHRSHFMRATKSVREMVPARLSCSPRLCSADDLADILRLPRKAWIEIDGALLPVRISAS